MNYFNIIYGFLFLPIVIILYNIMPKKIRPIILLIASYVFYFLISKKLIIFIILSSLSIYLATILMQKMTKEKNESMQNASKEERKIIKEKYKRKKKIILIITIIFNFAFLFYFKYLNFFKHLLQDLFKITGNLKIVKHLAPIGISFYTLQAISYVIDVYNEKIEATPNIGKVFLYLSFFPTIMEGPITRFSDVNDTIYEGNKVTYHNFCFGYQRILWGFFKKYIIADRLNIFVKLTFNNYFNYSGLTVALGIIFYTILLYMEFSGTMDVVIGSSEIFGINIPENFRQPFFSKNISEFWSRWHITLGLWFKNYIFYPVSLSKPVKKITTFVKEKLGSRISSLVMGGISLFVVWFLNGLWHGAGYTFLFFGMYHFFLIITGNILEPLIIKICDKLKINRQNPFYKGFQIFKTTILIFLGELFFRANSIKDAFLMLKRIITHFNLNTFRGEIFTLGLDIKDFLVILIALLIVLIISILKEKGINIRKEISTQNIVIRFALYYALIIGIIVFGAYGPGYAPVDPIYADF